MRNPKFEIIKELLTHIEFVPTTGRFIWKDGVNQGKFAGSCLRNGYREIAIVRNKKRIRAFEHQIVWYLHHRTLPKHIHHKNEVVNDNRLENLEEAYPMIKLDEPLDELALAKYIFTKVSYDSEKNVFLWSENRQKKTKRKRAGNLSAAGYWMIKFRFNRRCVHVMEHRLIWFFHNGKLPDEIDHINGVRDDNRIENLRSVNRYGNAQNLKSHRDGKLWGVTWESGAWRARFRLGETQIHVGRFPTKFQAYRAVIKKAKELGISTPT